MVAGDGARAAAEQHHARVLEQEPEDAGPVVAGRGVAEVPGAPALPPVPVRCDDPRRAEHLPAARPHAGAPVGVLFVEEAIGRASCRESGGQYGEISVDAEYITQKKKR